MFEFAIYLRFFLVFVLDRTVHFETALFFVRDRYTYLNFVSIQYVVSGFCCCAGVGRTDCCFWQVNRLVWLPSYCWLDLTDYSASKIVVCVLVRDLIVSFLVKSSFCKKMVENFISFGFSFPKHFQSYLQTLRDRFYFRIQGRCFATHKTLKGRQFGLNFTSGLVKLLCLFR